MGFECSAERPWGIHPIVRNDRDCPRCGWTAPGPIGDARADIQAMDGALAAAAQLDQAGMERGSAAAESLQFAPTYQYLLDASRSNGAA